MLLMGSFSPGKLLWREKNARCDSLGRALSAWARSRSEVSTVWMQAVDRRGASLVMSVPGLIR